MSKATDSQAIKLRERGVLRYPWAETNRPWPRRPIQAKRNDDCSIMTTPMDEASPVKFAVAQGGARRRCLLCRGIMFDGGK